METASKDALDLQKNQTQQSYQNKPKQCSTNQVTVGEVTHEVTPPEQSPSSDFKDEETYTLFSLAGKTNPIIVTVNVNSQPIQMEVDTGAALSIISKTTFESNQMLKPSTISLKTYTGQTLPVLGMIETHVEHNAQSENLPLIVVDGNRPNLLGRN